MHLIYCTQRQHFLHLNTYVVPDAILVSLFVHPIVRQLT